MLFLTLSSPLPKERLAVVLPSAMKRFSSVYSSTLAPERLMMERRAVLPSTVRAESLPVLMEFLTVVLGWLV